MNEGKCQEKYDEDMQVSKAFSRCLGPWTDCFKVLVLGESDVYGIYFHNKIADDLGKS